MRITNNMLTRNYLKNLGKNQRDLAASGERLASGRRYSKGSENVSDAVRALSLRSKLSRAEDQEANIRDASSELDAAEGNLDSINKIMQTAIERITRAVSDTYSDQRGVISGEIEKLRDQVLQFANAQFSDKFLFSGSNNGTPPFAMDADGSVTYNNIPVADIYEKNGAYFYKDTAGAEHPVPQDEEVYIDVGFGVTMSGGQVDPNSAFKISFSGLDILGFGSNADGVTNNLVELLGDMSTALKADPYDPEGVNQLFGQVQDRHKELLVNVTDIGTRSQFLDQSLERLTKDIDNMTILDSKLEYIEDSEEAMNQQMYHYTWLATLSYGSKVIPQSLMDFLR